MMKKLVFLVFMVSIAACSTFQPPLTASFDPDEKYSYVYADVYVADNSLSLFGKLSVALSLTNTETSKPLYLRFREENTAYVVKILPGPYELKGVAFLNHYNEVASEKPLPVDIQFTAKAGTMYYLGDFKGIAKWESGRVQKTHWSVYEVKDNFINTTEKVRSLYSKFTKVEAVNAFKQR